MTKLSITSFGFRHGEPPQADLVVDVRSLDNPDRDHFIKHLRGVDQPIIEMVRGAVDYQKTLEALEADAVKVNSVAVGCRNGYHRSVVVAEDLGKRLKDFGCEVKVIHRDIAA